MSSTEIVNYDLQDGVALQYHSFVDPSTDRVEVLSGDEVMPSKSIDEARKKVYVALNHLDRVNGPFDQRVHFTLLNDLVESPDLTLVSLQWNGRFQDKGVQDRLVELAVANPERRFLVSDNLGYGESDPLPKSAKADLIKTGRFDVYAQIVYRALGGIIRDHDELDIFGLSEGGIIGTELAIQAGSVRRLSVFDPPSTPMTFKELYGRYTGLERAHGISYNDALVESGFDVERSLSAPKILWEIAKDIFTGRAKIQLDEGRAMARGSYEEALTEALPIISEGYDFLSPLQSEINSPLFIRNMIAEAVRATSNPPRAVDQVTLNGTHAFGYGNPRAIPAIQSRILSGISK